MKVTSAYANKLIRGYREELAALISSEKDTCTTIYGASETPIETGYDFSSTQAEMDALNDKIAKLRHGINVFNTTTKLEGFDFTVDESLVRMAMLTEIIFCYRIFEDSEQWAFRSQVLHNIRCQKDYQKNKYSQ